MTGSAEVFTPKHIAEEMTSHFFDKEWDDPDFILLDPACGDGNLLTVYFEKKRERCKSYNELYLLSKIIGIDIHKGYLRDCRSRLATMCKDRDEAFNIVNHNIIEANFLTFDVNLFKPYNYLGEKKNGKIRKD